MLKTFNAKAQGREDAKAITALAIDLYCRRLVIAYCGPVTIWRYYRFLASLRLCAIALNSSYMAQMNSPQRNSL
jgi:hypothetical protein